MSEGLLITVIGAVTGLITAIVTSFLIPIFQRKQEKIEQRRSVHEKYAQPLAADAVNLLWRFDEILFKGRGQYLREDAPPTPFNRYKLISTCYRIAAVLGWIRAIKLEQSYLFYGEQESVNDLRVAVVELESMLADSQRDDSYVVRALADLWSIQLPNDPRVVDRIGARNTAELQHFLSAYELSRYQDFSGMEEQKRRDVVRRIALLMTDTLGQMAVAEHILADSSEQALLCIAGAQAWIYRDWQQAIGNLMIRQIEGASRRFDIIDYGAFEMLFTNDSTAERLWMDRLRAVVVGIETDTKDEANSRLFQLQGAARAVASLVCAIERLDLERKILAPEACALARRFLTEIPEKA